MTWINKDTLESEVNAFLRESGIPTRISRTNERVNLYVLRDGRVYKEPRYPSFEESEKIIFRGKKIPLMRLGEIDPSEINKESRGIRRLVPGGKIGELTPYRVTTESGEEWDDWIVTI